MDDSRVPPSGIGTPYLSTEEAANYLRISLRVLQSYRISGEGPAYRKHGARVVYHLEDLERWSAIRRYRSAGEREGE